MAGGYYTALSGMNVWLQTLDRLSSDIANSGTSGYKAERAGTQEATRPAFDAELQSAIDVSEGASRLDLRPGALAPTGGSLDLALEGQGFFVVETAAGQRFTRNGRFERREDGVLTTSEGDVVVGENGTISLGVGPVSVEADGTVRSGNTAAGKLKIVSFANEAALVRESAVRLRNTGDEPDAVEHPSVRSGALEQSNVSVVDRLAQLTSSTRNFEALQRALSVLVNDVDSRAISELGRR
jgi:flagellar basal body rod protein FlgG